MVTYFDSQHFQKLTYQEETLVGSAEISRGFRTIPNFIEAFLKKNEYLVLYLDTTISIPILLNTLTMMTEDSGNYSLKNANNLKVQNVLIVSIHVMADI